MFKNALGLCYDSSTIFQIEVFVAKVLNSSKLCLKFPIYLQVARTDYELYDSVTDNVSDTNHKKCQLVGFVVCVE